MRVDIPFEILFAFSIFIFTISLFVYGLIIKRLLPLIEKKGIWILPVIGSIFLVISAVIHFYRIWYFGGALTVADPADLFPLIKGMLRANSVESFSTLSSALLTLLGITVYYRWISK
ncbi:MAG: hypothetical protein ABIN61_06360 [candidate division WOR-3 bacterium]